MSIIINCDFPFGHRTNPIGSDGGIATEQHKYGSYLFEKMKIANHWDSKKNQKNVEVKVGIKDEKLHQYLFKREKRRRKNMKHLIHKKKNKKKNIWNIQNTNSVVKQKCKTIKWKCQNSKI